MRWDDLNDYFFVVSPFMLGQVVILCCCIPGQCMVCMGQLGIIIPDDGLLESSVVGFAGVTLSAAQAVTVRPATKTVTWISVFIWN